MKITFLFRDSYDSRYILSNTMMKAHESSIILETGKIARMKKLKRIIKDSKKIYLPLKLLDIIVLLLYSFTVEHLVKKNLGSFEYPDKIDLVIDDANESKCIEYIKKHKPDIVFIFGTSLLGKKFLREVKTTIINIHTGIVPHYRNVHSDFWAYMNEDFKNIGVSLMYVDKGVDTGDIFIQKSISYKKNDSLVQLKVKNLKLCVDLLISGVELIKQGKRLRQPQKVVKKKTFFPTPGFIEILKFIAKEVMG